MKSTAHERKNRTMVNGASGVATTGGQYVAYLVPKCPHCDSGWALIFFWQYWDPLGGTHGFSRLMNDSSVSGNGMIPQCVNKKALSKVFKKYPGEEVPSFLF